MHGSYPLPAGGLVIIHVFLACKEIFVIKSLMLLYVKAADFLRFCWNEGGIDFIKWEVWGYVFLRMLEDSACGPIHDFIGRKPFN